MAVLLYRVLEVAAALKQSRGTVLNLIRSGQLESIKIGRSRRVPADALEAFVDRLREEQSKSSA